MSLINEDHGLVGRCRVEEAEGRLRVRPVDLSHLALIGVCL